MCNETINISNRDTIDEVTTTSLLQLVLKRSYVAYTFVMNWHF